MARFHQTAFWLLLVGIVGVHCYPPTIVGSQQFDPSNNNEHEETPSSSSIDELDDDLYDEDLDITGDYDGEISSAENADSTYGARRVRREKKLDGVEKKKTPADARRAARQLVRAAELELALQRAREFQSYVTTNRLAGLSEFDAILQAAREHPILANQVLASFNPNHDQ